MTSATNRTRAPSHARARGAAPRRKFLPEVQALRALAVMLVLIYHIDPRALPGGYIGVDVFFVISGFLITGHLWREASSSGKVSLRRFWAARARRILPASLVTTAVTIAVAVAVLPLTQLEAWWRHALASVLYVENWALAGDAVDYQAATNEPTAFQHFWSLGVEEQFYLFWPLLVVVAVAVWARGAGALGGRGVWGVLRFRGVHASAELRAVLLVLFGMVFIASFAWSYLQVQAGDPVAYYSTLTRVWELAAGGILALVVRDTEKAGTVRGVIAAVGVAAILGAALLYDDGTAFPGLAALLPTLGACAVIAAGRTSGPSRAVAESWVAQRIGDISYSLYLWHFPVVVFYRVLVGQAPGPLHALAILAASFVLAIASYALVEQPVRRARSLRADGRMLLSALVAMALVAGLTFALPARADRTNDLWDANASSVTHEETARALDALDGDFSAFALGTTAISPNPLKAGRDKHRGLFACLNQATSRVTKPCELGETQNPTATVAVVGDSHAGMFAEPLLALAEERRWRVVTYLHGSCPFSAGRRARGNPALIEGCAAANEGTRAALAELEPDLVVTAFLESTKLVARGAEKHAGAADLAQVWNELSDQGSQVIVLRDTPLPRKDVVECVSQHYRDPDACARPVGAAFRGRGVVPAALELAPRARVVDFADAFCDDVSCPAVNANVLVYRDENHVSSTYLKHLTPRMRELIPADL